MTAASQAGRGAPARTGPIAAPEEGSGSAPDDRARVKLSWLLRLKWAAIAGQTAVVLGAHYGGAVKLPLRELLAVVALEAAATVGLEAWSRRGGRVTDGLVGAAMLLDTLALTGLLHLSGGPYNPFDVLYLVIVALAAILLPPGWAWLQAGLAVAASGALIPLQRVAPLGARDHEAMMRFHAEGIWIAMAAAAGLTVHLVHRVTRALERRERELERARSLGERREKLAALATLAAGAAHELATPLSTIAVAANELERTLASPALAGTARADLGLIRAQVARCRDILQQMAARAGENAGEPLVAIPVADWIAAALDGLPGRERVLVPGAAELREAAVRGPPRGLARALRCLVANGLQASAPGEPVEVRARADGTAVIVEVVDRGAGMTPEVLGRAGEPFFTTKGPGEGSGLGLFLARALAEQLGGRLDLESGPGRGTTAALALPAAAGAAEIGP